MISQSFSPMQSAEQNLTPRLLELYRKDTWLFCAIGGVVAFSFFSVLLALNQEFLHLISPFISLSVWILIFGVALDLFIFIWRRSLKYLNPFQVVGLISQSATKNIQENKDVELCESIDALSEIAIRSIKNTNTSLSLEAISEIRQIARVFLGSSKSIVHEEEDPALKQLGVRDSVAFVLFYILQRFETIHDHALEKKLEPICSSVVTGLGKIAVYAADYDITLTSYPLHFMHKLALRSLNGGLPEVGVKATLALVEMAKGIVSAKNVDYMELQPPFLSIINTLQAVAKDTFRLDKSTKVQVLLQPFFELRELFKSEKMANHQDTPVILQNIDRVIAEFETLETVLKTMPLPPTIIQDTL